MRLRQDFVIAAGSSAIAHLAFMFGIPAPKVIVKHQDPVPVVIVEPLPPIDDEPEKKMRDPDEEEIPVTIVPPLIPDIPKIDPTAPFTQPTIPPPPSDIPVSMTATIPPINPDGLGRNQPAIFNLDQLDQQPQARVQAPPSYPYSMRSRGIAGEVEVGFICTAEGGVTGAYVMKSSHREFEQSALQAVNRWRFKPGLRAGRAVNVRMSVVVVFNINN